MGEDRFSVTFSGEAAQIIRRISDQGAREAGEIIAEAISTRDFVQEELWSGGEFFISRDGGITYTKVIFSFQPPRVSARPGFLSWLGTSPYLPLLAGVTVTMFSSFVAALIVGGDAFRFATATILVSYVHCALLGGAAWLIGKRAKKGK